MEKIIYIEYLEEIISDLPIGAQDTFPSYCKNPLAYGDAKEIITKNAQILEQKYNTDNFKIAAYQSTSTKPICSLVTMLESALLLKICREGKAIINKPEQCIDPREATPLQTDDIAISYHSVESMHVTSEEDHSDFLLIQITKEYIFKARKNFPSIHGCINRLEEDHLISKHIPVQKLSKELSILESKIRNCSSKGKHALDLEIDGYIHEFLITLEALLTKKHKLAIQTNYLIVSNFRSPFHITNDKIAKKLDKHEDTITSNYYKHYQYSISDKISILRIEEALHLWIKKRKKIKLVGEDLGIYSTTNISRDIKDIFKNTPTELREIYNKS